jgi:transcriptional regulator with XRE-family HTH domain
VDQRIPELLESWFKNIDAHRYDLLVADLHPEVEFADELTGRWLRGRESVERYLNALSHIIADLRSELLSVNSHMLTDSLFSVTFEVRQSYVLDGSPCVEVLASSALVTRGENADLQWLLFHQGAPAEPRQAARAKAEAATPAQDVDHTSTASSAIRDRREGLGLSLRQLAARVELSPGYLSQVERGLAAPSVSTLRRIVAPLGLTIADAIPGPRVPSSSVTRREQRRRVSLPDLHITAESLSPTDAGAVEATLLTIDYQSGPSMRVHSNGAQFGYVIEGGLYLWLSGQEYELGRSDAFYIADDAEYEMRPLTRKGAQLLSVRVTTTNRGTEAQSAASALSSSTASPQVQAERESIP